MPKFNFVKFTLPKPNFRKVFLGITHIVNYEIQTCNNALACVCVHWSCKRCDIRSKRRLIRIQGS